MNQAIAHSFVEDTETSNLENHKKQQEPRNVNKRERRRERIRENWEERTNTNDIPSKMRIFVL